MEGRHIFMYFVQWLIYESKGVTWDGFWNIFLTSTVTLNLVSLASANRWSRRHLRKFYKHNYEKHRRMLNKYLRVTAWYDALQDYSEDEHSRLRKRRDVRWMDQNWMIQHLQNLEAGYHTVTCEGCAFRNACDAYDYHLQCCFENDCEWCYEVRHQCWDCSDFWGIQYCEKHVKIIYHSFANVDCKCISMRKLPDDMFLHQVKLYVPKLEQMGWEFRWWKNERGLPRLTIVAPDDRFTESEELACQYYNE